MSLRTNLSPKDIAEILNIKIKSYDDFPVSNAPFSNAAQVYNIRPALSSYTRVSAEFKSTCLKNIVSSPWTREFVDTCFEYFVSDPTTSAYTATVYINTRKEKLELPIKLARTANDPNAIEAVKEYINLIQNLVVYSEQIAKLYFSASMNLPKSYEYNENLFSDTAGMQYSFLKQAAAKQKISYNDVETQFNISCQAFEQLLTKPLNTVMFQQSSMYQKSGKWTITLRDLKSSSATATKEVSFPTESIAVSNLAVLRSGYDYQTRLKGIPTITPYEYLSFSGLPSVLVEKLNAQIKSLQQLLLMDLSSASESTKQTVALTLNETLIKINVLKAAIIRVSPGASAQGWNTNYDIALIKTAYTGGELAYWNGKPSSDKVAKAAAGAAGMRLIQDSNNLTSLTKNLGATLIVVNGRTTIDKLPSFVPTSLSSSILPLLPASTAPKTTAPTYDTGTSSGTTTKLRGIEQLWAQLPTDYETAIALQTKLKSDYRAAVALIPKVSASSTSYTVDYAKAKAEADKILSTLAIVRAIVVMHYTDVSVDNRILNLLANFKRAAISYLSSLYQNIEQSGKIGKTLKQPIANASMTAFTAALAALDGTLTPIESTITGPPVPEPIVGEGAGEGAGEGTGEEAGEEAGASQEFDQEFEQEPEQEPDQEPGQDQQSPQIVPPEIKPSPRAPQERPWYMHPATIVGGAAIAYFIVNKVRNS